MDIDYKEGNINVEVFETWSVIVRDPDARQHPPICIRVYIFVQVRG